MDKVPQTAYSTVAQTSDNCGFFCLAMVEYLSLRRGEGPKQRGSQHFLVADLKTKLSTFTSQLKAEAEKLLEEKEAFLMDQAGQLKKALTTRKSWRSKPRRRRASSRLCRRPLSRSSRTMLHRMSLIWAKKPSRLSEIRGCALAVTGRAAALSAKV